MENAGKRLRYGPRAPRRAAKNPAGGFWGRGRGVHPGLTTRGEEFKKSKMGGGQYLVRGGRFAR